MVEEDCDCATPQIPALDFSLAILAKLGPLEALGEDFWIPAPALAALHREPNASPPGLDAAADLLDAGAAAAVNDEDDETLPPAVVVLGVWNELAETEVK